MLWGVTDFWNGIAVYYNKLKNSFSLSHKIHVLSWLSPFKTWVGVSLFVCTFAKTYFVISSKLSHNSISRQVWTDLCEYVSYFLKAVRQFYFTKKCRELYILFAWNCFHNTCLLAFTYKKESFRSFVIDEISLESSRL